MALKKITFSLDHLRQKARHALFSLRRKTDFKSLKPSLACKIFDSGVPLLSRISSPIEKAHLQFCKRYASWKCITKCQTWQVELNLVIILRSMVQ